MAATAAVRLPWVTPVGRPRVCHWQARGGAEGAGVGSLSPLTGPPSTTGSGGLSPLFPAYPRR